MLEADGAAPKHRNDSIRLSRPSLQEIIFLLRKATRKQVETEMISSNMKCAENTKQRSSFLLLLGTIALAPCLLTLAPTNASAQGLSCEISRVDGLGGWSDAARKYWLAEITARITERARVFYETGAFKPASYTMNGITASIASAKLQMIKVRKESAASDQTIVGHVPGTEVPVYDVKSRADSAAEEAITVEQASFRLPVRLEDLPTGAKETAVFSAICSAGAGSPNDERRNAQRRSSVASKSVIR